MSQAPAPTVTQALSTTQFSLQPNDSRRLAALCGQLDSNLKMLEKRVNVQIKNRGNLFEVIGFQENIDKASALLKKLYGDTHPHQELSAETIHLSLQQANLSLLMEDQKIEQPEGAIVSADFNPAESADQIKTRRKLIKPKGSNQIAYVDAIRNNDINFGIGPAGTGKTWLAVACAVEALEQNRVERILLVRPAVEAGENLGFLPGDLTQKIDPYLRPLYDALYEMMGVENVTKRMERNIIELAPLAFMRGRTLNNSFIILDESQNTTREQMKMFLTRIGFGSTAVITGDDSQIDLPRRQDSGLLHVKKVLQNINGITFTQFNSKDVVRHPLVQKIVEAYAVQAKRDQEHQDV